MAKVLTPFLWNIFFWGTFFSAWLGSKVLFLLTTTQDQLLTNSSFWLGGGFVFYGGLLFALVYILGFCLLNRKFNWRHLAHLVPVLLFSHGLGRIGCFLAGCCYGKESELFHARHPVQLYEALSLIALSFLTGKLLKKDQREEFVMALYFLIYALLRFVLEFLRDDTVRGFYGALSTSQWISLFLLIPSAVLMHLYLRRKKHGI